MPILTAGTTLDMTEFDRDALVDAIENGTVISFSATAVVVRWHIDGVTVNHTFSGSGFGAPDSNGFPTTGAITGYELAYPGPNPLLTLTGLSFTTAQLSAALAAADPTAFTDLLYGGSDVITGGDDPLIGDVLNGHGGDDTIHGLDGQDLIRGGAGNDTIHGGDETGPTAVNYGDYLMGEDGDDTITGGVGRDTLLGGSGVDSLNGGDGNDVIYTTGGDLTDRLLTAFLNVPPYPADSYPVRSALHSDILRTDGEVDTVQGGAGDDTIFAGIGDIVDGGDGTDAVEVNFGNAVSALNLNLGAGAAAALAAAGGGSYVSVERFNVRGSGFNDHVIGTATAETLYGGAGADLLEGGDGADTLVGAAFAVNALVGTDAGGALDDGAADTLSGGEGNDLIHAGAGDHIDGGAGTDSLYLTLVGLAQGVTLDLTGADRWDLLASASGGAIGGMENLTNLTATHFNDEVRVAHSGNFYMLGGDDLFHGNDLAQFVGGNEGDDVIHTYGGADRIWGGAGNDVVYAGDGNDFIYADLDNNGNANVPGSGNDYLDGGAGSDQLFGGGGDDIMVGGAGNDIGEGGEGIDTIDYSGAGGGVTLTFDNPLLTDPATLQQVVRQRVTGVGSDAQGDAFFDVERVVGSAFDDQMFANNALVNIDLFGGAGNDALTGGNANNRLEGGEGDDVISDTGFGHDTLLGGAGDDQIFTGRGHDAIDGGAGIDLVSFHNIGVGFTIDLRTGTYVDRDTGLVDVGTLVGVENLVGSQLADIIHGDDGANVIEGGGDGDSSSGVAGDLIYGYGGDDRLFGRRDDEDSGTVSYPGGDTLYGGDGNDHVRGGNGDDVLHGEADDDTMFGDGDNDTLHGGSGIDTLNGGHGDDLLNGDGGDDLIDGGAGDDVMNGGDGDDVLLSGAGVDDIHGGAGHDRADYSGNSGYVGGDVGFNINLTTGVVGFIGLPDLAVISGVEDVVGTDYVDTISGSEAANVLDGGGGGDYLRGGGGGDVLFGRGGEDTAVYSGQRSQYVIAVVDGALTVSGPEGVDRLDGIEKIQFSDQTIDTAAFGLFTTGGPNYDQMHGAETDDVLDGAGGPDEIYGYDGDDLLTGGDGDDVVNGGMGSDVQHGGEGDDHLNDEGGSDQLFGEGGNDTIVVRPDGLGPFPPTLPGEEPSGPPERGGYTILLDGGSGDDDITYSAVRRQLDTVTAIGGDGADFINVAFALNTVYDAGTGDDLMLVTLGGGDYVITTGAGSDVVEFTTAPSDSGAGPLSVRITDFTGGVGGDILDVWRFVNARFGTASYEDPFALGQLRLIQNGADTVLQVREASGTGYETLVALDGVQAWTLTADNFSNNFGDFWTPGGLIVNGTAGGEVVRGAGRNDTLNGEGGDDVLIGGAGVDALNGGAGFDTADYSTAAAGVTARLDTMRSTNDGDGGTDAFTSIEALTGSAFNDLLIGGGLGDTLRGGLGADTLLGQGGNDVLWGGAGAANQLQGGAGDDRYVLEANDSVIESAGQGADTVEARIGAYTLSAHVENLVFGGVGNFTGAGNALNNTLTGGAGDDVLRGRGGTDILQGGLGMDTADYSFAAAGIHARLDNMRAVNDGDGGTDTFVGIEAIVGSNFNDLLVGGGLGDRLSGGFGADTLLGFAGDDILAGGQGAANQLQGGLGDDLYILDAYDTVVELAGQGVDTVEAHVGAHNLGANVENMYYVGNNKFYGAGNALNNVITGGIGDDILKGMGGDDTLRGGAGHDQVQFRGSKAQYTVTAEGNGYRIVDSVAGRDGSTLVESIEVLRFMTGNTTTLLTYPSAAPAAVESIGKGEDAFVLPALPDDEPLVLPGIEAVKGGEPLVLPGSDDATPLFLALEARLPLSGDWMLTMDGEPVARHDDWMS